MQNLSVQYRLKTRDRSAVVLDMRFRSREEAEQYAEDLVSLYPDEDWRDIYEVVEDRDADHASSATRKK